jgi:hypothetical protein
MSEDNSWADQWFKAQQQFVDAWSDMAKTGSSGNASQSDLWAHSFDLWRKACEGKTQPDMELAMRKCMDMGKEYFAMAEQVSKGLSEGANPVEAINQWLEQMKQSLQQFGGMPGFNGAGSKCQLAGNGGRTDADEPGDVANARHEYFGFQPG